MADLRNPYCEGCGVELPPARPTGPPRRFCTAACKSKSWRTANPEKVNARYAPHAHIYVRTCSVCGDLFTARGSRARACPKQECQRKKDALRQRAFQQKYGAEHGSPYSRKDLETRRARELVAREEGRRPTRQSHPERYRAHDQLRRARKFAVPTEAIDATVIYERDEWKCGICGGKVAQDLRYPDPRSASLDHVVPLAEGGSHTAANVRCSHLECNVRRGTRGEAEQLRMVG